jgi:hypothetical protein
MLMQLVILQIVKLAVPQIQVYAHLVLLTQLYLLMQQNVCQVVQQAKLLKAANAYLRTSVRKIIIQ